LAADESARWQTLFASVPALPAAPTQASKMISAREVWTEGLGIAQLRIEVADAGLRGLQQDVERLFDSTAKVSAEQIRRTMDAIEKDPVLTEWARKIDEAWRPDPANPDKMPSPEELRALNREMERFLGPNPTPGSAAPAPQSEIAAYRVELQRTTPRASQFLERLTVLQRQYAQQHMQADRATIAQLTREDVTGAADALVARHHALAQQQLVDASAILEEARVAVAPRVLRLVELARAAELRNAPLVERNQAYVLLKSYVEFLLTLEREALQDAGFWGGIRVTRPLPSATQAGTHSLYEQMLAPGFELRANGELPYSLPYYPLGRAIVVGLPPGIH
jgi:hypothetical protein